MAQGRRRRKETGATPRQTSWGGRLGRRQGRPEKRAEAPLKVFETVARATDGTDGSDGSEGSSLGDWLHEESLQFGVSHYDCDNLAVLVQAFIANGHISLLDPSR